MKPLFLICWTLISFISVSELQGQCSIDIDKINGKKIRHFYQEKDLDKAESFLEMEPTCHENTEKDYSRHLKVYHIDKPLESVWLAYTTSDVKKIWDGRILNFAGSFIGTRDTFIYDDASASYGIEEGQIMITKLRLMRGLIKIVVAHEISMVDTENKVLEFCYIKGGKTAGSQTISFSEGPDGSTIISHETYYKSRSKFRDKRLYPKLHTRAIDDLHANVSAIIEAFK